MSNKKTKKQKKQSEQRRIKEKKLQIQELQELKNKAIQLENKIINQKTENFKQFNIRNLKIFGNTCNFVTPFILSAGLTVGVFRAFGGGLPFQTDEIIKYKVYDLEYETNGIITMNESYQTNRWFDNPLSSNELTIYTPWECINNQYVRYKREYIIEKIDTLDLYNAVLDENYDYIFQNMKDCKEEKQVANTIEEIRENNYFFEASLHMLDKDDILKYNETDLKNKIITIIELILGLGIGGVVAHSRNFEYLWELKNINIEYHERIKDIKPMQEDLKITNEKILSLSKKMGGKINEK